MRRSGPIPGLEFGRKGDTTSPARGVTQRQFKKALKLIPELLAKSACKHAKRLVRERKRSAVRIKKREDKALKGAVQLERKLRVQEKAERRARKKLEGPRPRNMVVYDESVCLPPSELLQVPLSVGTHLGTLVYRVGARTEWAG